MKFKVGDRVIVCNPTGRYNKPKKATVSFAGATFYSVVYDPEDIVDNTTSGQWSEKYMTLIPSTPFEGEFTFEI